MSEPKVFVGLAGDFDNNSYVLLEDYQKLEADLGACQDRLVSNDLMCGNCGNFTESDRACDKC
jgi:hypothetical protein